jgi:hypothetical protein
VLYCAAPQVLQLIRKVKLKYPKWVDKAFSPQEQVASSSSISQAVSLDCSLNPSSPTPLALQRVLVSLAYPGEEQSYLRVWYLGSRVCLLGPRVKVVGFSF